MNGNFYVIQEWFISELGLKGLERDLYAIIYGFAQDGQSKFYGSLNYLAKMTGYSRQAVISALKKLNEKGLLIKEEETVNGVAICKYSAKIKNVEKPKEEKKSDVRNEKIIRQVINLLNEKSGKDFRWQSGKTQSLINARLNDGFTIEDFEAVIYNKVKAWKGSQMEQYLRPETLFGTKFESYKNEGKYTELKKKEKDYAVSSLEYFLGE